MKIFEYIITTDADLVKGMQVCYPDINGSFTKLGVITDIFQANGKKLYVINTSMGAYLADELKLIDYEEANTFEELEFSVIANKSFVPVTESLYFYALTVLPPVYLKNGTWQLDECETRDLYHTFGMKDGKYYGCICNKNFALNNF